MTNDIFEPLTEHISQVGLLQFKHKHRVALLQSFPWHFLRLRNDCAGTLTIGTARLDTGADSGSFRKFFISSKINWRRFVRSPVNFTNNTFAFIAAMSRMFPQTARGHRLKAGVLCRDESFGQNSLHLPCFYYKTILHLAFFWQSHCPHLAQNALLRASTQTYLVLVDILQTLHYFLCATKSDCYRAHCALVGSFVVTTHDNFFRIV